MLFYSVYSDTVLEAWNIQWSIALEQIQLLGKFSQYLPLDIVIQ